MEIFAGPIPQKTNVTMLRRIDSMTGHVQVPSKLRSAASKVDHLVSINQVPDAIRVICSSNPFPVHSCVGTAIFTRYFGWLLEYDNVVV